MIPAQLTDFFSQQKLRKTHSQHCVFPPGCQHENGLGSPVMGCQTLGGTLWTKASQFSLTLQRPPGMTISTKSPCRIRFRQDLAGFFNRHSWLHPGQPYPPIKRFGVNRMLLRINLNDFQLSRYPSSLPACITRCRHVFISAPLGQTCLKAPCPVCDPAVGH
jgi:hypothetical protein